MISGYFSDFSRHWHWQRRGALHGQWHGSAWHAGGVGESAGRTFEVQSFLHNKQIAWSLTDWVRCSQAPSVVRQQRRRRSARRSLQRPGIFQLRVENHHDVLISETDRRTEMEIMGMDASQAVEPETLCSTKENQSTTAPIVSPNTEGPRLGERASHAVMGMAVIQ